MQCKTLKLGISRKILRRRGAEEGGDGRGEGGGGGEDRGRDKYTEGKF